MLRNGSLYYFQWISLHGVLIWVFGVLFLLFCCRRWACCWSKGLGWAFIINILLTLLGYFPGLIHAFWVQSKS